MNVAMERSAAAATGGWADWNDRALAAALGRLTLSLAARASPEAVQAEALAARHAAFDAAEAEAAAALAASGHVPAAIAAAERCGLSAFEVEVLLLALAAEVDRDIAALLSRLGVGGRPTPALAASLAGKALPSALLAFSPAAPLVALRLIELDPAAPLAAAPFRLAPRVRDFLLGLDRLDPEAGFLAPLAPIPLPTALRGLARRIAAALTDRGLAFVTGEAASGTMAVAAEAARIAGMLPMRLDASVLPAAGPSRQAALALAAREAALSRLCLVLPPGEGQQGADRKDLIEHPCGRLIVVAETGAEAPAGAQLFEVPSPGLSERAAMWRAAAPRLGVRSARRLAAQYALSPEVIARVAARGGSEAALWRRAREAGVPGLAALGQRLVPRAGWDDLVLPPDALAALRDVAAAARVRDVVDGDWGFVHDGGRGEGIALLLSGPSGTGKTLAAEVLAGALDLDLFRIDLSGVVSKWIGETEKNLRRVFDAAEAGGAVLFFDEADALFGKRSEVKDSHDRYANVEVGYLLQRMEAYRGLSILATNLRGNLDPAFLRRIRYAVDLPLPDEAARRAIWQRHLPRRAPLGALDLDTLARLDLTGGSIRTVALNGAAMAAAAGEPIATHHMLAAARREFAKLGRGSGGVAR